MSAGENQFCSILATLSPNFSASESRFPQVVVSDDDQAGVSMAEVAKVLEWMLHIDGIVNLRKMM